MITLGYVAFIFCDKCGINLEPTFNDRPNDLEDEVVEMAKEGFGWKSNEDGEIFCKRCQSDLTSNSN